jgi:isopentenyl-diphosphate delta-isomerase
VFNDNNELLVTQRAYSKKVWPGVWTNSVCGHPAPGETFEQAIERRMQQELGMTITDITVQLPEYKYTTPAFNGIIENEVCPVFFAKASSEPKPNPVEVKAYKWLSWHEYSQELQQDKGNEFSWWSKDQFKRLTNKH